MTTDPSPERLSDQAGRPAGVKRTSNSSIIVALSRRSNHQITHEGETTHGPWVMGKGPTILSRHADDCIFSKLNRRVQV